MAARKKPAKRAATPPTETVAPEKAGKRPVPEPPKLGTPNANDVPQDANHVAQDESEPSRRGLPVAGICASAGGLSALKRFFAAMPGDSGIAFVLVPHLDPTHESLMSELISRQTAMPVIEAADGAMVEANCVYIIPPNKYMTIDGGALRLTGPVERQGAQTSLDLFLRSLADDQREKAICIILSGTGSHGTLGLRAVKAGGGMAMVQDPETAEYDRMPQSALATGLADYVLPVEQMPSALVKYAQHFCVDGAERGSGSGKALDHLNHLVSLLRARTRFDFRYYRKKMLLRRIERRMGLTHFEEIRDYLDFLREHPDELEQLARDLLINVTNFFRDPEAFRILESEVIAPLVRSKEADAPVRVWVPGCATGEEPYSLGMLIQEQLALAQKSCGVQIFATEVDETSLEIARQASYPESITAHVSAERLQRFFVEANESAFRANKQLRESVVFALQNLISDAPFSRLDLISCRNVLIYFEPEVQKKVISLFHFALNPGGYLFLGPSETIGRQVDLFKPISKKWRIYSRLVPTRPEPIEFPISAKARPSSHSRRLAEIGTGFRAGYSELTHRALLEEFGPAAVLINRQNQILYFFGPTTRYLDVPTGEPTQDLMVMAREGLRTVLRTGLSEAIRHGATVRLKDAQVKRDGSFCPVIVTIKVVHESHSPEGLFLVAFQDAAQSIEPARSGEAVVEESLLWQMESELKATREDLRSTIEELESSNEELKASNEEMMSINEELQSANEELETSKEELQSLNEEISTVNNQLHDKVEELESSNNDFANLFNCAEIATVFLDRGFRIKRFTPPTTSLLRLIATDIGRHIDDIARTFTDPKLLVDAARVLRDLTPSEEEVLSQEGRTWVRRLIPYRTLDNRIEGVVLTFNDITLQKRARELLQGELDQGTADLALFSERLRLEHAEHQESLRDSEAKLRVEIAALEQQRIGEDLHDDVGQELTALGLLSDSLTDSIQKNSPADLALTKKIREGLNRALARVRAISRGLVSVETNAALLPAALLDLAARLSENSEVNCTFRADQSVEITNDLKARHLFLIAQEACSNAMRHGHARNIAISLSARGNLVVLQIQDDGDGMPARPEEGLGLRIMRNRASVIQGTFKIEPSISGGTEVTCTIFRDQSREQELRGDPGGPSADCR
jgi:two-component system, chemotaxis family, CheB/CheR fusion protein